MLVFYIYFFYMEGNNDKENVVENIYWFKEYKEYNEISSLHIFIIFDVYTITLDVKKYSVLLFLFLNLVK